MIAVTIAAPFLFLLIAVSVQLIRQLRDEPVVSTVPEGVYTALYQELGASRKDVDESVGCAAGASSVWRVAP